MGAAYTEQESPKQPSAMSGRAHAQGEAAHLQAPRTSQGQWEGVKPAYLAKPSTTHRYSDSWTCYWFPAVPSQGTIVVSTPPIPYP